jgi:uncharacterized protein with GYD domain
MATYLIMSKVSPQAVRNPNDLKLLSDRVSEKIKRECPGVTWKKSYATLGRFDMVDIVESQDSKQVEQAAIIMRSDGQSTTETLLATPWDKFLTGL